MNCCESSICDDCKRLDPSPPIEASENNILPGQESLNQACPICSRRPVSKDDCKPNEKLREALRVWCEQRWAEEATEAALKRQIMQRMLHISKTDYRQLTIHRQATQMKGLPALLDSKPPLPFFLLPREVRDRIYCELFLTTRGDKTVTPDPTRTRRCYDTQTDDDDRGDRHYLTYRTLATTGISFLCTCQQVLDEATDVLYGKHTFLFSDQPHREQESMFPGFETLSSTATYEGPLTAPRLPVCDYSTMSYFLWRIGKASRKKIRHIKLEFSSERFIKCAGEEYFDHGLWSGGDYTVDALECLSEDHGLETMDLILNGEMRSDTTPIDLIGMFFELVFFYESGRLRNRIAGTLLSITGIQKFTISQNLLQLQDYAKTDEKHESVLSAAFRMFPKLKQVMEAGYATRKEKELLYPWTNWFSSKIIDQGMVSRLFHQRQKDIEEAVRRTSKNHLSDLAPAARRLHIDSLRHPHVREVVDAVVRGRANFTECFDFLCFALQAEDQIKREAEEEVASQIACLKITG